LHALGGKSSNTLSAKQAHLERLLDIRKETDLLIEIKDIRDEIKIILSVITKQQELMEGMRPLAGPYGEGILGDCLPHDLVKMNFDDFSRLDGQALAVQDRVYFLRLMIN
jgi:hypothetical protein